MKSCERHRSAISDPWAMVESRRACGPVRVWRSVPLITGGGEVAGDRGSGLADDY